MNKLYNFYSTLKVYTNVYEARWVIMKQQLALQNANSHFKLLVAERVLSLFLLFGGNSHLSGSLFYKPSYHYLNHARTVPSSIMR